jgi:CheY-like chemotaxis protein
MVRSFAALVVDSDLKGLEALVYGFQGADWRITACPAPDTAAFLVKASAADIVVVASREPHDKALALVRQLRSQDDTRALPLLVLGPASLRDRVLEVGTVDFLSTPVFVRDAIVAGRIAIAVARDSEPKIEGNLTELSLLSLLRCMSGLGRSGVLQIERAGRRGEVLFSEGELTGAQLGALQGSAALHHLLMWEEGKISLALRAVGRRAPINQRFDQVIEEAERFLRDYSHAIAGLGCSSTVYDKNEAKLSGSAQSLPSEVMPIVRLCDGQRTLADLIDQSPFRVFDTIRIVNRLVDLGALSKRQATDGGAQPAQDLQKFWETARISSPDDNQASAQPAARGNAIDTRVGEPNRRKLHRRARSETPVLGTPIAELVVAKPPCSQSAASGQQQQPDDANKGKERTSGVLQVPTGERRQAKHDRRERPSVTIDVGLVEAVMETAQAAAAPTGIQPAPTPAVGKPVVTPAAKAAPTPAMGKPAVIPVFKPGLTPATGKPVVASAAKSALTPAAGRPVVATATGQEPASSPAPAPEAPSAAEASATRTGRITGSLQVAPSSGHRRSGQMPVVGASVSVDPTLASQGSEKPETTASTSPAVAPEKPASVEQPAAQAEASRSSRVTGTLSISPSQRTSAPKTHHKEVSVQLDPVLMAELDRLEKATVPVGPPASSDAPTAPLKVSGNRVTGTLSTSSSPRSSNKPRRTPTAGASVALDPSLVQEDEKLASAPAEASTVKPPAAPEPGTPVKRPSQPMAAEGEGGRAGSRISGAFNAVESDFFAREADLYKRDGDDNFSDLDEPAGRAGSKNNGRRQNRR